MSGVLYMIASPIGNLDDFSLRAIKVLQSLSIVACEDTRHTAKLLSRHGIGKKKLISYYNFNERQSTKRILESIHEGFDVGFITDAGTPLISDPGFFLVRAARSEGITISPIPGVSALTAVISVCPIPANRFFFEGFLPHAKGRKKRLDFLSGLKETTIVFYESPYRIIKLLMEIKKHFGNRDVFIGREATKMFEEFLFGSVSELIQKLSEKKVQGEFVVVVSEERL